ncbi:MAG: TIGR01212 family radical SAM protein [Muribaculaceae bacterium]|nr:TIGR01212 family radical SAM protein [Muribaculaceae bacterium]
MNPYYKDYNEYLNEIFPDIKVQKLSVNAGFSCPNRDGTIGRGGCIYCDNTTFTPSYCFGAVSVRDQIAAGKKFFSRKYPAMKYLAYFQSFTNTFSKSHGGGEGVEEISRLEKLYREALDEEDVVGLVIGSRPDCFPSGVVELLERLNREYPVFVELGAETSHDATLKLINRGHTWEQTCNAARRLSQTGIHVGLHLISGLPGETEEMILSTVREAGHLPVDSLKLHHLQVIESTPLHRLMNAGEIEVKPFSLEEYLDLCVKIINIVPRNITIERFLASSPPDKVVAPKWGIKNYEFTNLLLNRLKRGRREEK